MSDDRSLSKLAFNRSIACPAETPRLLDPVGRGHFQESTGSQSLGLTPIKNGHDDIGRRQGQPDVPALLGMGDPDRGGEILGGDVVATIEHAPLPPGAAEGGQQHVVAPAGRRFRLWRALRGDDHLPVIDVLGLYNWLVV